MFEPYRTMLRWAPPASVACPHDRSRRLRTAKLRYTQACIENLDFTKDRGLDRRLITDLTAGHWLREHHNLLLCGAYGCGKTWIAWALGQKAARLEFSVLYYRLPKLFADLALAHGDGRYPRLFRSLYQANLLILDDWRPEPMTTPQDRYGLHPLHQPDPTRALV